MRQFLASFLIAAVLATSASAVAVRYAESITNVLKSEGGYSNDAGDPGGPTNYGITIHDVRLYINPHATARDVRALTRDEAIEIYRTKYWAALRLDDVPAGLDYTIFDYGVNSGIGRSGKVLRQVLKLPANDWHVTDDVLEAIKECDCTLDLIRKVNDERLRFLKRLRTWHRFGRGWGPRVASVRARSIQIADPTAHLLEDPVEPFYGPGKAYDRDLGLF